MKISFKRGTTSQCDAVTPDSGEPLYDETIDQLRIGDGATAGGDKVAMEGVGISRTILCNAFQFPDPAAAWVPALGGAYLASSLVGKYVYLPISGLAIGDIITSYNLVGDAVISGTSTLDCKITRLNKANPPTTTDLTNGGIAQVTADGNIDSTANVDDETITTDKQYVLVIQGTTDVADTFVILGAEVVITRLP